MSSAGVVPPSEFVASDNVDGCAVMIEAAALGLFSPWLPSH